MGSPSHQKGGPRGRRGALRAHLPLHRAHLHLPLHRAHQNATVSRYQVWRPSLLGLEAIAIVFGGHRYQVWKPTLSSLEANATRFGGHRYQVWRPTLSSLEANATRFGGHRYQVWRPTLSSLEANATRFGGHRCQYDLFHFNHISIPSLSQKAHRRFPPAATRAHLDWRVIVYQIMPAHVCKP